MLRPLPSRTESDLRPLTADCLVLGKDRAANTIVTRSRPDIEELLVAAAVRTFEYEPSNRVGVSGMEDILAEASTGEY